MYLLLAYFLNIVNNFNGDDLFYHVAKFMLEHLADFDAMSLQDLADGSHVSVPTVKQFLRRFDYSNYTAFKRRVLGERDSRLDQIRRGYDLCDMTLLTGIAQSVSNAPLAAPETMDAIVDELVRCGRVIVIGSPTIVPVLSNFQIDLSVMGKPVILSSQIKSHIVDFRPDDLILLISGTGRLFLSEDHLQSILGQSRNRIVIFSGGAGVQVPYNVAAQADLSTDNEMFQVEYLLMAYFDMLRCGYYRRIYGGKDHD